jgi:TRAP-type C4-dicarboxylate transport system permease small subunit
VAILVRAVEIVVILLMGVITGVVIGETVMRGMFDMSLIVTDELSRYLMVWTALLAAALLVYEDGHIRISLLPDALGAYGGKIVYVLSQLVVLAFLAAVIVASLMIMPSITKQNTVTLGLSMAWFYAALPVSSALMAVFAVRNLIIKLRESPGSGPATPDRQP